MQGLMVLLARTKGMKLGPLTVYESDVMNGKVDDIDKSHEAGS